MCVDECGYCGKMWLRFYVQVWNEVMRVKEKWS